MRKRVLSVFISFFMSFVISLNTALPVIALENSEPETVITETVQDTEENREAGGENADTAGAYAEPVESSGMILSASMKAEKKVLADLGIDKQVERLIADCDYVNHEVIYSTGNKKEAEQIAKAYHGKVTSFSNGVAVIKVPEDTEDVMEKAADVDNDFPAIYPNFLYKDCESYSMEDIEKVKTFMGGGIETASKFEEGDDIEKAKASMAEDEAASEFKEDEDIKKVKASVAGEQVSGESPVGFGDSDREQTGNTNNARESDGPKPVTEDSSVDDVQTMYEENPVTQADIDAVNEINNIRAYTEGDLSNLSIGTYAVGQPNDAGAGNLWHHQKIGTYDAWKATKGKGVTVAVIDSGIQKSHPDLKANISGALNTCSFALNGSEDNNGHGTHVAGIIAAVTNNGKGVAGVAPEAKILSIKALDWYMSWDSDTEEDVLEHGGTSADITRAVNLAVSKKVDVINMSLGGYYDSVDIQYANAVKNAINNGIVVVVAAGNDNKNLTTTGIDVYPAEFDDVICVSATTKADGRATYSNYGSGKITIAAPGGGYGSPTSTDPPILSTYLADTYTYMYGTSMAAPVVSGTVALLIAANPAFKNNRTKATVEGVTEVLKQNAQKDAYSNTGFFGEGLVNAAASLGVTGSFTQPLSAPELRSAALYQATLTTNNAAGTAEVSVVSPVAGAVYYYTLDGKEPTLMSAGIKESGSDVKITVDGKGKKQVTLKIKAYLNGKFSATTTATYTMNYRINSFVLKSQTGANTITVAVSKTAAVAAAFTPAECSNKTLDWQSSDTGIVIVDAKGNVKGITEGTATITATTKDYTNQTATINITVKPLITSLATTDPRYYLATAAVSDYAGTGMRKNTYLWNTITAEPSGVGGVGPLAARDLTYKTSNRNVAVVDADGQITAVGSGTATITATAMDGSGKKVTCNVNVVKPAAIINFSCKEGQPAGKEFWVAQGKTINLAPVLETGVTDKRITWQVKSGSESKVTVLNGKVTGLAAAGTPGYLTVKSADGCASEEIVIHVTPEIMNTMAKTATLKIIDEYGLPLQKETYNFKDAIEVTTDKKYTFSTSNGKVAVVDPITGVVTAQGKGTATITAKLLDGSNKKVTCKVTVKKPVTDIAVWTNTSKISVGKSMKMGLDIYPSDASVKDVKWELVGTPAAKGCFSIDSKGNLKALSAGTSGTVQVKATPTDPDSVALSATSSDSVGIVENLIVKLTVSPASIVMNAGESRSITFGAWVKYDPALKPCGNYRVSEKDERVADYVEVMDTATNTVRRYIEGRSQGTTTITFAATDGSGKQCTVKVTVKAKGDKTDNQIR